MARGKTFFLIYSFFSKYIFFFSKTRKRNLSILPRGPRFKTFFFSSKYLLCRAKQIYTTRVFARDIWLGCEIPRLFRARIQEVRKGDNEKEQEEEGGGIPDSAQRSRSTIPSRFGSWGKEVVHGMWYRQPSGLSPPSSTPSSLTLLDK